MQKVTPGASESCKPIERVIQPVPEDIADWRVILRPATWEADGDDDEDYI